MDEGAQRYVTVGEAAKALGVHRNTIHNHIKTGKLNAHKVYEANKEFYRVELPEGLYTSTPVDVAPRDHLPNSLDDLFRRYFDELGGVREELGVERTKREFVEQERDELKRQLTESQERRRSWLSRLFGN